VSVSSQQAVVQVPYELNPNELYAIEISHDGGVAYAVLPAAPQEPAFLTGTPNQAGPAYALAINADGTVNSAANPAVGGTVVTFYINGAGILSPLPQDGTAGKSGQNLVAPITVSVAVHQSGTDDGSIEYAGAAPGLAGILQLNVRVPGPPYFRPLDAEPAVYLNLGGTGLAASFWFRQQ